MLQVIRGNEVKNMEKITLGPLLEAPGDPIGVTMELLAADKQENAVFVLFKHHHGNGF